MKDLMRAVGVALLCMCALMVDLQPVEACPYNGQAAIVANQAIAYQPAAALIAPVLAYPVQVAPAPIVAAPAALAAPYPAQLNAPVQGVNYSPHHGRQASTAPVEKTEKVTVERRGIFRNTKRTTETTTRR